MRNAVLICVLCLGLVLSQQQCAVYKGSGAKGFSKIGDQENICGNYLTPNDLVFLPSTTSVSLQESSEIKNNTTISTCLISDDDGDISFCKISEDYKQKVADSGQSEIFDIDDFEYTYFRLEENSDEDVENIYAFMSHDGYVDRDLGEELDFEGVMCRGIVGSKLERSATFQIAITILDNLWYDFKSLE